jgi:hypothetical protein
LNYPLLLKGISNTIDYGRKYQSINHKKLAEIPGIKKNLSPGYERKKSKRIEISCSTWHVSPSALLPFIEQTAVSNFKK